MWLVAEFFGEEYALRAPSQFALLEFSAVAQDANDDTSDDGIAEVAVMAAVMHLLEEIVDPKDWKRFAASSRKNKATTEDHFMPLIQQAAALLGEAERPTVLSSDSSDGQEATALRSVSPAVSRVLASEAGRPDRQVGILRSA